MNHHLKQISIGLLLWTTAMVVANAEPTTPAPKDEEKPKFEATADEIKLPGVTINRATREARIDAEVCLQSGFLEYVVCRPDTFEHEAIFTTKAKPELVHAALLLCGLKPTPQLRGMSALWSEKAMQQKRSRVKIEVEWELEGVKNRVNLTSFLRDRGENRFDTEADAEENPEKEPLVQDAWIFAGSFLHVSKKTGKRFYAANSSGILVGIWPDPSTVIQYGVVSGDPYKASHLGLEIHEDRVPKVGTKVKLVFSLHTLPVKK
jgi:hypothetical protein